jgi:hypothetical protein
LRATRFFSTLATCQEPVRLKLLTRYGVSSTADPTVRHLYRGAGIANEISALFPLIPVDYPSSPVVEALYE